MWRRRGLSRSTCLKPLPWALGKFKYGSQLTLGRFAEGPERGVPSLLSLTFALAEGSDSSRTGLTFKSAYFLQLVPQFSQRTFVGRPLGAFHQNLLSLVLQAPQLGVLDGWATIEPSSSESPTCWPSLASASFLYCLLTGFGGTPIFFMRSFSSPNRALQMRYLHVTWRSWVDAYLFQFP